MSDSASEEHSIGLSATRGSPKPMVWKAELVHRFWDYHSQFQDTYFTAQFGDKNSKDC